MVVARLMADGQEAGRLERSFDKVSDWQGMAKELEAKDAPAPKTVEPPKGVVYSYPPRGDEQTSMFGAPARSEVGAQMYNQAINTVMVAKFTQGNEKLDDVIKWAEKELEGTLRA